MERKDCPTQPTSTKQQPGTIQRIKDAAFVGAVVASTAMIPAAANAGELETALGGATGALADAKTAVIGLITAAVVIIGIVIGWRYFKRGAN